MIGMYNQLNCGLIHDTLYYANVTWWRHQMETFSALLAICTGIHRSPVNSPHKGQWCGALMFSLICVWINGWVNNREAGDLRRYHDHCDFIDMSKLIIVYSAQSNNPEQWGVVVVKSHLNLTQRWEITPHLLWLCNSSSIHDLNSISIKEIPID